MDDLLEDLAVLQHEAWRQWRRDVEKRFQLPHSPCLDKDYSDLTEAEKEEDRVFARRVMRVIAIHFKTTGGDD